MRKVRLSDMIETVMSDYACERCGFWYSYHDTITLRCPYRVAGEYNTFNSSLLEKALNEGTQPRTINNPLRSTTNPNRKMDY